jgi:hypothetical protein
MKLPNNKIVIAMIGAACALATMIAGCSSSPTDHAKVDVKAAFIGHAPALTPAQQQQAEVLRQAAQAKGQADLAAGQLKSQQPTGQRS